MQLFDEEGKGSLGLGELSGLMGALLGFPQNNVAELYSEATNNGRLTEGEECCARTCLTIQKESEVLSTAASLTTDELLRVLTTHPTYQRVLMEHVAPGTAGHQLANGKAASGNNNLHEGSVPPQSHKKNK